MRERYKFARSLGLDAIDAVRYAVHRDLTIRISGDIYGGIVVEVFSEVF